MTIRINANLLSMKKSICNLVFYFFLFLSTAKAGTVDTVSTFSPSMKRNIKAVVIKPDNYSSKSFYPVVYLLHGAGGDYSDWIKKVPNIAKLADTYNLIIVCPNGESTSWYFDSPVDPTYKQETYISSELVKWVDSHYNTINDRGGRAITGLSMGGHGALYLAFRHQDVFGVAGSMSGGVDLRPFPNNWDIAKRLGSYAKFPDRWEQNSIINLTHLLTPTSLSLIIDCGINDFFYPINEKLHEKLQLMNIPHDFIARPGEHSWAYWANSVQYQMLFLDNYFKKARKSKD